MKKKGMAVKVFFLLAGLLALTLSVSAAEVFQFEVSGNKVLNGFFSSIGGPITVEWGDGTQNTFSGEEQRYVKDYGKSFTGKVTVRVPEGAAVTGFRMETSGAKVRFALADLPKKLTYLHCGGLNSVYGNLSDLPPAMDYYYCEGNNTVTGNLKDLPRTLRNFNTHGRNTIRGDFSDLPPGLTFFRIAGRNTVQGDIASLPQSLTFFLCAGGSNVTGDISKLPKGLTSFYFAGNGMLTGDIASLPAGLTSFHCAGINAVNGDISKLPAGLASFHCAGSNTVSGSIAKLPAGLTSFHCAGSNTVSGDISKLPAGLTSFHCAGFNTVSGDISKLPQKITYFYFAGSGILERYNAGRKWSPKMSCVHIQLPEGRGINTESVDALLEDLAQTTWAGEKKVWLAGNNAPRSSASDSAAARLEAMGVTLFCNVKKETARIDNSREEPQAAGAHLRELFVAPGGSDSNPGTAERPFATISKAAETARAGDRVQVRAGIYRERVVFPQSGEPGKPIVFTGERGKNGEWLTVIDPGVLVTGWKPASEVGPGVYKTDELPFNPLSMNLDGQHLARIADRWMQLDKGTPPPVAPLPQIGNYLEREREKFGGFSHLRLAPDAITDLGPVRGGKICYWDGVEVLYGYLDGVTYIRFRNGDDPRGKQLAAAGPGPAVLIDNRSHLVVRDFEMRGAELSLVIQGREAANNIIEHNYMMNGRGRMLVTRGASRNIIQNNKMTLNYIGHRPGVTNSHIYQEFKHLVGGNMSDDQGITVSQAGPDNVVRDNRLDKGLIGIAVNETLRARVYRNVISGMSSIGLITERGAYDCMFYDNLLFNNGINTRIHDYWAPGYPRREYHFRNISLLGSGGCHVFVHHDKPAEEPDNEMHHPEIFLYHNTYVGGGENYGGVHVTVMYNYWHMVLLNNVFSKRGRSLAEWFYWENPEMMAAADHNWLAAPAGRKNPAFKRPAWFGEHNITGEGRLLWPEGTRDFIIPESSAARGGGIDLSRPFSICGRNYPALPGMEPGYFSGSAPDMGALQRGQTLDPVMARELPAK